MDEFPNEPTRQCVAAFDLVAVDRSQIHHPIDLLHRIAVTEILKFENEREKYREIKETEGGRKEREMNQTEMN